MSLYNVELNQGVLKVSFGDQPAGNDKIVPEAVEKARALKDDVMGKVLKINGSASLPVAIAIGHELSHVVPALACFDPKLGGYVVAVSHSPEYKIGQIIN